MQEIIVTKSILIDGSNDIVKVLIGKPHIENEVWRCPLRIELPGHLFEMKSVGVDSLQALVLALKTVGNQLNVYNRDIFNGKLKEFETGNGSGGNFGFPILEIG